MTAAGKKAQRRAEQVVDADAETFFGRLSEADRKRLHDLLRRLNRPSA